MLSRLNLNLTYSESIILLNAIKRAADKMAIYSRTILEAIIGLGAGSTLESIADDTGLAEYESAGTGPETVALNNALETNFDYDPNDGEEGLQSIYAHRMLKGWLELHEKFCQAVFSTTEVSNIALSTAISKFLDEYFTVWRQRAPELFLDLAKQSRGRVQGFSAANISCDGSSFDIVKNRMATLTASAGPTLTPSNVTGSASTECGKFPLKTYVHTAGISGGDMVISVNAQYTDELWEQVDLTIPNSSSIGVQTEHLFTTTDGAIAVNAVVIPLTSTVHFNVGQMVLIRDTETSSGASLDIETWGVIESVQGGDSITLTAATKCLYAFDSGALVSPMFQGIHGVTAGGANAATAGKADIYPLEDRNLEW